jgi:hypothetical protein
MLIYLRMCLLIDHGFLNILMRGMDGIHESFFNSSNTCNCELFIRRDMQLNRGICSFTNIHTLYITA